MLQTLFIFGNGFDIAHGIKTPYSAFREFLKENHESFLTTFENVYFINPLDVADWAYSKRYFNQAKGTNGGGICDTRAFTEVESKFGAQYGFKYVGYGTNLNNNTLKNHLSNGGTAIGWVDGHYMCLVDYNASIGKFLVFDPAPGSGTRRAGITTAGGDWKTIAQLSKYPINVKAYWMFSKR